MENQAVLTPFQKKINAIKTYVRKPSNLILIIFAVLLTLTVIVPLIYLLLNTFLIHRGETFLGKVNTITILHWKDVLFTSKYDYSLSVFWGPLGDSILMALVACFVAVFVGGGIAFLITRTDFPAKKFISLVFVFPYIMPSWSIAMFWENFFKNTVNLEGIRFIVDLLFPLKNDRSFVKHNISIPYFGTNTYGRF